MALQITLLISFLLFEVVAGHTSAGAHRSRRRSPSKLAQLQNENRSQNFTLVDLYRGNDFLTKWEFFTADDPTHGSVRFQSKQDAMSKGLAYVQDDGTTILAVDDKTSLPIGVPRDSVRINTKKTYTGGLFIADFWSMPHGCSVWPAYWSVGPDWPHGGEIDVLEGVHEQETNTYSLHTAEGCSLSTDHVLVTSMTASTQCLSGSGSNAGCNFIDNDKNTYGHNFNIVGGGVYAHTWDDSGIRVWHFPRFAIPADINDKKPDPSAWGPPSAFWSASSCDVRNLFRDHQLVIDTTLCGDLGEPTFSHSGCKGSCSQAVADPRNFRFAKWQINYIAVYQ